MSKVYCADTGRHGGGCTCAFVGCPRGCVAGWLRSALPCPEHAPWVPHWCASIAREAVESYGALQKADELAAFLHRAHSAVHAPDAAGVVVEIGSDAGGTLYAWRQLGAGVDVLAVSLDDGVGATGRPVDSHGARIIRGDSHDPATLDELRRVLDGRAVDVLFIDGDHSYEGCRLDVEMYAPLLRPAGVAALHDVCFPEVDRVWLELNRHALGGLLGLHDVAHHAHRPDVGVERAWRELVELHAGAGEIITEPDTWGGIGYVHLGAPRPDRPAELGGSPDKAEAPRATNSEGFTAPHRTQPGDEMAADA